MSPADGLLLILIWSALNTVITSKRRRSPSTFLAISLASVMPMILLAGFASHSDGLAMGWAAFVSPFMGFTCPYYAEPIRRQATKYRHCASNLPPRLGTHLSP